MEKYSWLAIKLPAILTHDSGVSLDLGHGARHCRGWTRTSTQYTVLQSSSGILAPDALLQSIGLRRAVPILEVIAEEDLVVVVVGGGDERSPGVCAVREQRA